LTKLLEVRGLTVAINARAEPHSVVHDVSLTLGRGESLGLVGESGCGKSMTALALMGLLPPAARAEGTVLFDGQNLLGADERTMCALRGRRIAIVFQEPMTALNPVKCIGEQVAEAPRLHFGLGRADAEGRARRMLDRVGLPAPRFPATLYPHQLSGGQRQRVMIASALACGPDLLIADEPTTALDVTIQAQILDLVTGIARETGMALILISHDLGVVAETVERILVMYAGHVVEEGPTDAVFRTMAHPYARGLFAASPHGVAAEAGRRLAAIPGQVPDPAHVPPGCPFADRCSRRTSVCDSMMPPPVEIGRGHLARCYHPVLEQGAP
jgi:peptide/nickel transport system ATP-binding protein